MDKLSLTPQEAVAQTVIAYIALLTKRYLLNTN
jgi:hypothetical protein